MIRAVWVGFFCFLIVPGSVWADVYGAGTFQERFKARELLVVDAVVQPKSDPKALTLLSQMTRAMKDADYSGIYVHMRGDQIDTTQLTHRVVSQEQQERLQTLNGEPREVIRHGNHCECKWPARQEVVFGDFPGVRSRMSGARFTDPQKLDANYQIISLGNSRVAGHACQVLALLPRDSFRYGYKLCVDEASHVLLRMSIYNDKGVPLEHDFFTAITVHSPEAADNGAGSSRPLPSEAAPAIPMDSPGDFPPGYRVVVRKQAESLVPLAPDEGWVVSPDLPGYHIKSRVWRINPVTGHRFEHMIVTDGLSTASVFVENMPQTKVMKPNAIQYGMSIAVRQVGPMRVTVIGDLPMKAVEQICKHTIPAKDADTERGEQNPMRFPGEEAR